MDDQDSGPEWAKTIGVPDEGQKARVNVTQGCLYRELGIYNNRVPNEFLWAAEDKLIEKPTYDELKCQLPDSPRSTFLMVFSPDGKKVASTHGNHNVYVTDLTTGKNIQTLSGHPRTPWCIAFHPSSNQILASGCLAGQVRVWDLHGGSEIWTADSQSVIASLAFHPVDRMLVIATYNELHFWDWSQAKPFAKCSTKSEKEKVRYVSFDRLGNKLITGIANPVNAPPQWDRVNVVSTQPTVTTSATATTTTAPSTTAVATTPTLPTASQLRAATLCENYLLSQYSQLVRRYLDLSRNRVTETMDRGTDPMDLMDGHRSRSQGNRPRHGPMPSSSHASGSRSVRYRIMRSTSRSYRPPSSRERFRIHSSLLSGLPSRSSSSSNSLVRTTTTTATSSQSIILTSIATTSGSSSMPQNRVRQCGIGFIARPVCLTISRENSSSGSPSARSSQSAQSSPSGAVTNPTYTSYSDRSISSSRESYRDSERSRYPSMRPYRILFDDINQIRASVHSLLRPLAEENANRNASHQRPEVISPLDRRDRQRSQFLDVEEVEIDRDMSRSLTYVSPFRRLSSDSESTSTTPTNPQRPSPQQWSSYNSNHLPLYPRPVPRFQVRPTFDMNNTSPVRRFRDNTDSDSSTNTTPAPVDTSSSTPTTSTSPSPVQLNAGPVPRLQIRPRYLQDQSQLPSQSDNQSSGLQSHQTLRRQFVLSRHSNSPFQPRVPHVVQNSGLVTTATSSTSTAASSTSTSASSTSTSASSTSTSASSTSTSASSTSTSTSSTSTSASSTSTSASSTSTSAAASVITTAARPNSTPSSSTSTSTSAGSGSNAASVISTAASSTTTVASVICTATGPTSSQASSASTSAMASVISTAASVISTVASSTSTAASVICTAAAPNSTAAAASVITTAARLSSATVSSTSSSDEDNPISTASRLTSATASVITTAARSPASVTSSTSAAASVITTAARSASTSANSTSTAASVITTAARAASTEPSSTSTSSAASVITTAARAASTEPSSTSTSTAASVISTAARPTSTFSATSVISTAARSTSATASVISTATRSTPGPRSSSAPRSTATPASSTSTAPRSSSACCRPEIPSCMSSFVASGSSSGARSTTTTTTTSSAGSSSSRPTNTATTSTAGEDSFVRTNRQLRSRLHYFDHVKLLLRDRIRNSSEHASTDSTVNYSNIADELEGETQSTIDSSLEDGNTPSALEPRGLDPVLPSGSRDSDNTSDVPFFPSTSSTSSGRSSTETLPSSSNTAMFDLIFSQSRLGGLFDLLTQSGAAANIPNAAAHLSALEKIRVISRHVDCMQRLCRSRIEIFQLQQIRRLWLEFTEQMRNLHHLVQNRNTQSPIYCPREESRDPTETSAVPDDAPVPGPSTSQQSLRHSTARGRSSSPARFSNRVRNVVESMVNSVLNDEDLSDDETETAHRARTRRATRQQASEVDDPQPGPSGLNRSSHPRRDDIQTRLYRSLRDVMKRHKRKKEAAAAAAAAAGPSATATASTSGSAMGAAGQSTSPRQANRGRARRNGRHSNEPSRLRDFPALGSNLDFVISELEGSTPNANPNAWHSEPLPSTSRACHPCDQRRRLEGGSSRQQKRRAAESVSMPGCGASPPKMVRTEVERRAPTGFECPTVPNPGPPIEFHDIPSPSAISCRELLRRVIQRMETMLRFQREAFARAERETEIPHPFPPRTNSSDDSDSDDTSSGQNLRNLPKNYRATRRDITNLGRAVSQFRARRLLDYMDQSLAGFFEECANMDHPVNDQVITVYSFMHLSLELTDMLLEQLGASSNDLERAWGLRLSNPRILDISNAEAFFPDQTRALRRLRDRTRAYYSTCIHASIAREESRRFQNQLGRSPSRQRFSTNQSPGRMGHHSSSHGFYRYHRPSSTISPGFRRFRRVSPRTSGALPSGWWGSGDSPRRPSQTPRSREGQTSVIVSNRFPFNVNNTQNQVRGVRIWERRNSVDGESDFHRDLRSDDNNNSNPNLGNASSNLSGAILAVDNTSEDGPTGRFILPPPGNSPNSNLSFSAYLNLREQRPMFWIRYGNTNEPASAADPQSREGNFTVPVVHVNDIPVQDVSMLNQPRYRPQSPTPRGPEEMWRWRAWRPRFLHPRYSGPHTYDDQDANDVPEGVHYYRIVNSASGSNPGLYSLDPVIITDAPMSPHHRIQAWDFSQMKIPDISDREVNGVVAECKIHNDASVDVSNDGHLLVTLLPSGRFSVTTMLGVYSLDWNSLGQLLYKTSFEQNAVSVSLSPTNRHLLVGLASRPLVLRDRVNMAQIFRMEGARPSPPGGTWQSGRGRLVHMRDLEQTRETNIMSLNCIRWAPGAGQGLVYGTNTGQLRVLR